MKKILIIEDEPSIRENIQEILEGENFEVLASEDGLPGVQLAQAELPDLILCDIMMPEMDGYGVLATLRANADTASIPLIFLTAKADRTSLRQGMEQGADDYLPKPFTRDELLAALSAQFKKQAMIEQRNQMKILRLSQNIAYAFPRELLTPLNDILGMAALLIDEHGLIEPAEGLEIAEMIYGSGQSLQRLAQNFLIYTNLELISSNIEQVTAFRSSRNRSLTTDLIMEVALQKAESYGRKHDLHLEVQNYIVQMAEHDLRKVVEEVVDNAFKFSTPETSVRIIGCANDQHFSLYVIDHGRGITPEKLAEIGTYKQFERRAYEQKGCGLGLAITQRMIELYGGEFAIESIPNQQTIVRLSVPGSLLYTSSSAQSNSTTPPSSGLQNHSVPMP